MKSESIFISKSPTGKMEGLETSIKGEHIISSSFSSKDLLVNKLLDSKSSSIYDSLSFDISGESVKIKPKNIVGQVEISSNLEEKKIEAFIRGGDYVTITKGWKNVENISSRLLDFDEDIVVLECLTDRENGIYEEREFKRSLFEEEQLKEGNLFYLRTWERPNEIRIEIHFDKKFERQYDFPKSNLNATFKNLSIFKKR